MMIINQARVMHCYVMIVLMYGPTVFLRCFERPKRSQNFPALSQNTVEIGFTTIIKMHWNLALRRSRCSDKILAVF